MSTRCKEGLYPRAGTHAVLPTRARGRSGSMAERYALSFAIVLAAVLAVCVLLLTGCSSSTTTDARTSSGTPSATGTAGTTSPADSAGYGSLAQFSATTLDGGTFTQADLATKDVTLVNYWSTTCGPCIREMPDIAALQQELPDNVQLITVCLDGELAADEARSILESAHYEGTTLVDWSGDMTPVAQRIMYVPTSITYGPDGEELGEAVIGGQTDLESAFVGAINVALAQAGKDPIALGR